MADIADELTGAADSEGGQRQSAVPAFPKHHGITESNEGRGYAPDTIRRKKYNYKLSEVDDEFIIQQLEKHKTLASIANAIGCCRDRLAAYIHKNPLLQQVYTSSKNSLDDAIENKLIEKALVQGDFSAITFYMTKQMRHRGYGDEAPDSGETHQSRIVIGGDIPQGDLEEARRIEDEAKKALEEMAKAIPEMDVQKSVARGVDAFDDDGQPDEGHPDIFVPAQDGGSDAGGGMGDGDFDPDGGGEVVYD